MIIVYIQKIIDDFLNQSTKFDKIFTESLLTWCLKKYGLDGSSYWLQSWLSKWHIPKLLINASISSIEVFHEKYLSVTFLKILWKTWKNTLALWWLFIFVLLQVYFPTFLALLYARVGLILTVVLCASYYSWNSVTVMRTSSS